MASQITNIQYLKGVGEKRAELLRKLGLDSLDALLRYFPRRYEDWSIITPIAEAGFSDTVCIKARIISPITEHFKRKNMTIYTFAVSDDNDDVLRIVLFNNKYLAAKLHVGSEYLFYGRVSGGIPMNEMSSPEIAEVGCNVIKPIYSTVNGLSSKVLGTIIQNAIAAKGEIADPIPESIRRENNLCDIVYALNNIHLPKSRDALEKARRRFIFEELYLLQTGMLFFKNRRKNVASLKIDSAPFKDFTALLPYSLTGAQERAIKEALSDMSSPRPMNRLIQGDVGSGKTAVAAALCYTCAKNGYQSALMVPTEVLAEQHFFSFTKMFEGTGINCVLLTGSLTKSKKQKVYDALKSGNAHIVIGTHAILTEAVEFLKLGLVITDEQHRFCVTQRYTLGAKGKAPHSLIMSATPIPRTLSLIIYGDLDISIINEYPRGRQKIESYFVGSALHQRVYKYIRKHLDEGRQGYIICPLVEESETLDILSAQEHYDNLKDSEFAGYSVGLLHGKMKPKQKNDVMRRFKDGEIQLLISTTVIEVGVDVPNAAIMVIENAERFGLSQLHQLRGRIGRGPYKSTCILISDGTSAATKKRLKTLCDNSDGFKIADEDLKLRGPGDFIGQRQHGLPTLRIADMENDIGVLKTAGACAKKTLSLDPKLETPENRELKNQIQNLYSSIADN